MADTTKLGAAALTADAFASGAKTFEATRPKVDSGGIPYLKMDKEDGEWSFGQEDVVLPAGTLLAVYPQSFARGYVAWKAGKIERKAMAMALEPPINPEDLPQVTAKNGWEDNVGFAAVVIECPKDESLIGTKIIYEQNSRGGIEAWNKLFDQVLARAKGGHDEYAAIFTPHHTSYEHREYGKTYKPVFKLEDWESPVTLLEEFEAPPALGSKGLEDDAPKQLAAEPRPGRRRRQEEPDDPPVEDAQILDETPARRRRRRTTEE